MKTFAPAATPFTISIFLVAFCLNSPALLANAPGLRIEGRGVYTESLDPSKANQPQTPFLIKAQIASDGQYRLQVEYKNLKNTLVFDGSQTIAYRDILNDGQPSGADIRIVSGPVPEHLHSYVQAAWAASVFNASMFAQGRSSTNISPDSLTFLKTPAFFRKNFGEELLAQLEVETTNDQAGVRLSAYLPGNATRNGARMFESPEYTNGLLFHRLGFEDRDNEVGIYRKVALVDYLPYRAPETRDDVQPAQIHEIEILKAEEAQTVDLSLPPLRSLVAIMDYSKADIGVSEPEPAAYSISNWSDLKEAQALALSVPRDQTRPHGFVLGIIALIVLSVPLILWKMVSARRRHA